MELTQSTAFNRMVFMVDSTDHVTGKASLSLTITASKDGAAFASISPTVTDLGNGWYNVALTTTHTNTLGQLALHITGTAADPLDFADVVVATAGGAPTAAAIADAVWDEATAGHTTSGTFGEQCKTDIDAILDDTGTAGVVVNAAGLATDAVNEIADGIMNRASSNFEGTAPALSLGAAVIGATHKSSTNAGTGVQTIYKSDDATTFKTRTLTSDASLDPVQAVTKLA